MERRLVALLLLLLVLSISPQETQSSEIESATMVSANTVVSTNVENVPIYLEGYFSQYNQRPTDATLAYRIAVGEIDPAELELVAGVLATESCDHIGKTIWIRIEGKAGGNWLPVIVFDCSGHAETTEWMKEAAILGELGYYLAEQLGVIGETGLRGQLAFECPYC